MPTRRPKPKPTARIVSPREQQAIELKKSLTRAVAQERQIQRLTRQLTTAVALNDERLEQLGETLSKRSTQIAAGVASAEGRNGEEG